MKLKAVQRLVALAAADQKLNVADLIEDLQRHDIEGSSPDDVGNSIIIESDIETVVAALAEEDDSTIEEAEIQGGLYCSGTRIILDYKGFELTVTSSSLERVVIWI